MAANAYTLPENDRLHCVGFGCAENVISHVWSDQPIQSKLNSPPERRMRRMHKHVRDCPLGLRRLHVCAHGEDGPRRKGRHSVQASPTKRARGRPKTPEHVERHPCGKVPVLDYDGTRILETTAIARYLNDVLPGKSLIPPTPKDRARMDTVISVVDSYGYGALLGGVAAYHLFPDLVGRKNESMRKGGLENGRKAIELAMKTKGSSPFIAGEFEPCRPYLAPIAFYVSLTPDKEDAFNVPGFADWWTKMQALPSYKDTQPNLG